MSLKLYWNDGRGPSLIHFSVWTIAIAVVEAALVSPLINRLVHVTQPGLQAAIPMLTVAYASLALVIVWIALIVRAFRKCGWPAVFLLAFAPWILTWHNLNTAIFIPFQLCWALGGSCTPP